MTGLENLLQNESERVSGGQIVAVMNTFLELDGKLPANSNTGLREKTLSSLLADNQAKVVGEVTEEDLTNFTTTGRMLAEIARYDLEKTDMLADKTLIAQETDNPQLIDYALSLVNVRGTKLIAEEEQWREELQNGKHYYIVEFSTLSSLKSLDNTLSQDDTLSKQIGMLDAFGNALSIHRGFANLRGNLRWPLVIAVAVTVVIVIFSQIYLIDHDTANLALYRTLGATTWDILVVLFEYLLLVGTGIIIIALMIGTAIALVVTGVSSKHLMEILKEFYEVVPHTTILVGVSTEMLIIKLIILGSIPVSLLLMLDQFSTQRLSQKLKQAQFMVK